TLEHSEEVGQERSRMLVTESSSTIDVERLLVRLSLDRIELPDRGEDERRLLGLAVERLVEPPPRVRPAADLDHTAALVEPVVAGEGVGLDVALERAEERARSFARAALGVVEDGEPRSAAIRPEVALLRLPRERAVLDADRRVVGLHHGALEDLPLELGHD